jgi:hypothetical protein
VKTGIWFSPRHPALRRRSRLIDHPIFDGAFSGRQCVQG